MLSLRSTLPVTLALSLSIALSGCRAKQNAAKQNGSDEIVISNSIGTTGPAGSNSLHPHQKRLIDEAMTWMGTPYRYGGQDKSGTDCSGLTMQVYKNALGILLPRNSKKQQEFCNIISVGQIQAGDLIFFTTGSDKSRVSHVGMYVGDGYFIHSSGSKGVILSQISEKYYTRTYHSSGHVASLDKFYKPDKREKTKKDIPTIDFDKIPPADKRLETDPLRFELNQEIESKIDSVLTVFLD
ncbi:C40 family peptidase [uncultured Muribaculum sp.]|uniref:C40 family peptidase n=1 Tax=uncultured Muribaculum sp. TaxID=1918613 RepID=UPI0025B7A1C9|nr:C40 family peptidase [uncultured Muribaculum sp.]